MTPALTALLAEPRTGLPLRLEAWARSDRGDVLEGRLVSPSGAAYPIRGGIPRFLDAGTETGSVEAFGDQWNQFNFDEFRAHWLEHFVRHTFGGPDFFRGKLVIDAGAGAGMQSRWMLESGARHVILLELSHAVDGVVRHNLSRTPFTNYDVVQCSIDAPPLRAGSVDGLVICHNVLQHTPDPVRTAEALFGLCAPGGEFVFNCYGPNDEDPVRWLRFRWHLLLRSLLSRAPDRVRLGYAQTMSLLRFVPALGWVLEKSRTMSRGEVPRAGRSLLGHLRHQFRSGVLNTYDSYGAHTYQHYLSRAEQRALIARLQPDPAKVLNAERYFEGKVPLSVRVGR